MNSINEVIGMLTSMHKFEIVENMYLNIYNKKIYELAEDYKQRNIIVAESMFQVCNDEFNRHCNIKTSFANNIYTYSVTSDKELIEFLEQIEFHSAVSLSEIYSIDLKLFEIDELELEALVYDDSRVKLARHNEKFNDIKSVITILQEMVRDRLGLKLLVIYNPSFKMVLSDYNTIVEGEHTGDLASCYYPPFAKAVERL